MALAHRRACSQHVHVLSRAPDVLSCATAQYLHRPQRAIAATNTRDHAHAHARARAHEPHPHTHTHTHTPTPTCKCAHVRMRKCINANKRTHTSESIHNQHLHRQRANAQVHKHATMQTHKHKNAETCQHRTTHARNAQARKNMQANISVYANIHACTHLRRVRPCPTRACAHVRLGEHGHAAAQWRRPLCECALACLHACVDAITRKHANTSKHT
jgi:hypothetical protein